MPNRTTPNSGLQDRYSSKLPRDKWIVRIARRCGAILPENRVPENPFHATDPRLMLDHKFCHEAAGSSHPASSSCNGCEKFWERPQRNNSCRCS